MYDDNISSNEEEDVDVEDIYKTKSPSKLKAHRRKSARRKKAFMKAKEKAEQIIIENDLCIKIVYNNYISLLHDIIFVPGKFVKTRLSWSCRKCDAKLNFGTYFNEEKTVYVLKQFHAHASGFLPSGNGSSSGPHLEPLLAVQPQDNCRQSWFCFST